MDDYDDNVVILLNKTDESGSQSGNDDLNKRGWSKPKIINKKAGESNMGVWLNDMPNVDKHVSDSSKFVVLIQMLTLSWTK